MENQYQQIALALVKSLKMIQGYVYEGQELSDKELEEKLQIIRNILSLKFKVPINMFISLIQIMNRLLAQKLDSKKDFLAKPLLQILKMLFSPGEISLPENQFYSTMNEKVLEESILSFIRWNLSNIKASSESEIVPLDVTLQGLDTMAVLFSQQCFSNRLVEQFIPSLSSVAVKAGIGEYRYGAGEGGNDKVKAYLFRCWHVSLKIWLKQTKIVNSSNIGQKNSWQTLHQSLLKNEPQNKAEGPNPEDFQHFKLAECFQFLEVNLHKLLKFSSALSFKQNLTDNFHQNVLERESTKQLKELSLTLLHEIKVSSIKSTYFEEMTFHLLLISLTVGSTKLPQEICFQVKQQIYESFKKQILSIKKLKQMINEEERKYLLIRFFNLTYLLGEFKVAFQSESDLLLLTQCLKQLIQFESQRHMIQEMSMAEAHLKTLIDQDTFQKFQDNHRIISEYFSNSLSSFKQDNAYYASFTNMLTSLPQEYKLQIFLRQVDELNKQLYFSETSSAFQNKSNTLHFISYIIPESSRFTFLKMLLDEIDKLNFDFKYQIQEKFCSCLYFALYKSLENIKELDVHLQIRIFSLAFSGLSSSFDIINRISYNCLLQLGKIVKGSQNSTPFNQTLKELLTMNNSFFFNNLFAKLRYLNQQGSNQISTQHMLYILKSLKHWVGELLEEVVDDILQLLMRSIDQSLISKQQQQLLTSLEMILIISEHVRDFSALTPRPSKRDDFMKPQASPEMQLASKKIARTNLIRKLLLRAQPYITPTTQPSFIAIKAMTFFQNCIPYLRDRELQKETSQNVSGAFSGEDMDNVFIPCALAAISYELYGNFLDILNSEDQFSSFKGVSGVGPIEKQLSVKPHKIKVFEIFRDIVKVGGYEFLFSMKRFEGDILPKIQKFLVRFKEQSLKSSYPDCLLLRSNAQLLLEISSLRSEMQNNDNLKEDMNRFRSCFVEAERYLENLKVFLDENIGSKQSEQKAHNLLKELQSQLSS